jgi:hypothetical protein
MTSVRAMDSGDPPLQYDVVLFRQVVSHKVFIPVVNKQLLLLILV